MADQITPQRLLEKTCVVETLMLKTAQLTNLVSMLQQSETVRKLKFRVQKEKHFEDDFFRRLVGVDQHSVRHVNASRQSFSPSTMAGLSWSLRQPLCALARLQIEITKQDLFVQFVLSLGENKSLTDLSIRFDGRGEETFALATAMSTNQTLHSLTLRWAITETECVKFAKALKKNTSLTHLDLKKNSIGDRSAIALGKLLKRNTTLQHLSLSETEISDSGLLSFSESLRKNSTLTSLSLREFSKVQAERTSKVYENLLSCPSLKRFKESNEETTDLTAFLQKSTWLHDLQVSGQAIDRLLHSLKGYKHLKYLKLKTCVSANPATPIKFRIPVSLSHLELIDCVMSPETEKRLLRKLSKSTSLKTLTWKGRYPKLYPKLEHFISSSTSLTALNLSGMESQKGCEDAVCAVGRALGVNESLRVLNLSYCAINDAAMGALADGIKLNKTLKDLDMSHCGFAQLGSLPQAIANHPSLEMLDISHHRLRSLSIEGLKMIVTGKVPLVRFDIHYCRFNVKEVVALANQCGVSVNSERCPHGYSSEDDEDDEDSESEGSISGDSDDGGGSDVSEDY
eukprot:TRINITY_DN4140_c0_g1_i1.p1 TRINITY_DN4140_c0_g1~~TRINITY_DN4140_c0_g1_i1.p1  ORF type:complete len:570 (-),score=88.65 TRINITY_DN4140_c0_g1_i1:1627-3336(-)